MTLTDGFKVGFEGVEGAVNLKSSRSTESWSFESTMGDSHWLMDGREHCRMCLLKSLIIDQELEHHSTWHYPILTENQRSQHFLAYSEL